MNPARSYGHTDDRDSHHLEEIPLLLIIIIPAITVSDILLIIVGLGVNPLLLLPAVCLLAILLIFLHYLCSSSKSNEIPTVILLTLGLSYLVFSPIAITIFCMPILHLIILSNFYQIISFPCILVIAMLWLYILCKLNDKYEVVCHKFAIITIVLGALLITASQLLLPDLILLATCIGCCMIFLPLFMLIFSIYPFTVTETRYVGVAEQKKSALVTSNTKKESNNSQEKLGSTNECGVIVIITSEDEDDTNTLPKATIN